MHQSGQLRAHSMQTVQFSSLRAMTPRARGAGVLLLVRVLHGGRALGRVRDRSAQAAGEHGLGHLLEGDAEALDDSGNLGHQTFSTEGRSRATTLWLTPAGGAGGSGSCRSHRTKEPPGSRRPSERAPLGPTPASSDPAPPVARQGKNAGRRPAALSSVSNLWLRPKIHQNQTFRTVVTMMLARERGMRTVQANRCS